jgi:hypothetical protein
VEKYQKTKRPFIQGYGPEPVANKEVISGLGRFFQLFWKEIRRVIRVHQNPGSRFNEMNMDPQHCSGREVGFRDFRLYELFINDAPSRLSKTSVADP